MDLAAEREPEDQNELSSITQSSSDNVENSVRSGVDSERYPSTGPSGNKRQRRSPPEEPPVEADATMQSLLTTLQHMASTTAMIARALIPEET